MVRVNIYLDETLLKSINVKGTYNPTEINGLTLRCAMDLIKQRILSLISVHKPDYMRHLVYDRGYADIADIYDLYEDDIVFTDETPENDLVYERIYDMLNISRKLLTIHDQDSNISHMLEIGF